MTTDLSRSVEVQVERPAARRSMNEIEAMGKRAARGAGFSWGLAEEAGKAVRWLTARGYPGAEQLANTLTEYDKRGYAELAPVKVDGVWQAPAGQRLCPLIAGAAICDRAAEIVTGRVIELGETAQPLLLIPFVAGGVKLTGVAMSIGWDDILLTISPDAEGMEGNRDTLMEASTASVHCQRSDAVHGSAMPINELAVPVNTVAWNRLAVFAQRTFAPATESSRLSGAGAGLNDN